ncbi:hypothetical protein BABINDRAFT_58372 [Babjeviella inositovora NRRL Y-12698]|uniref:Hcy-binding domain-containing protein n=1 Tax=Babjeviella inositovora NRRL Y-12698 TaxID=984486 RepID=A0A1E3QVR3_9ASCO|nr:uncharacterized protein BABINDRAFT_58372 [Babjeviella inositovora NRRL Y-12698]ODQ81743.1 hypothetical protein BABINDRAFT_58372 [Babjeviella inositovora NRRL Y-12698]
MAFTATSLRQLSKPLILDGGLGSELELLHPPAMHHKLWSGLTLILQPEIITRIHYSYIAAGSDIVTTSSYQALELGLLEHGADFGIDTPQKCAVIFDKSIACAVAAVDQWVGENPDTPRMRPLVAAAIGPYGAYLANGAEYTGDYGSVTAAELKRFHALRLVTFLNNRDVDLLAFETFPNVVEFKVCMELLEEMTQALGVSKPFYVSFNYRSPTQICDGTPIAEVVSYLAKKPLVSLIAIGGNCVSLAMVPALLQSLKGLVGGTLPLLVYPNSGEIYDGTTKEWHENDDKDCKFTKEGLNAWYDAGVRLVGGCCRTGPKDIRLMRESFE